MNDRVRPVPDCIREAVCIHTKKIYDSCRDKDITPFIHLSTPQQKGLTPPRGQSFFIANLL